MFTCRHALWGICLAFAGTGAAADGPRLGESLSPEQIAALDYVVLPDGSGLPPGNGSAVEGAVLYRQHCLACHGENGTDGINDRLAGGHGTIGGNRPVRTIGSYWPYATTVFDYIRRAMPYQAPGSLSASDVYSVTAYLLFLNGIVGQDEVLDATNLAEVEMPNHDNFVRAYTPHLLLEEAEK